MKRETLLDYFADRIRSTSDFLVYDDGYRAHTYTYDDIRQAALAFGQRLEAAGVTPGQKAVIWSENRPEWIVALWGCLLARVIIVPIDYRASPQLLTRVLAIVDARVLLVGDDVSVPSVADRVQLWPLVDLLPAARESTRDPDLSSGVTLDELAEIIFTSGATAEPKGVQLTHRNILANILPVEREVMKYRRYARPFFPLRFLNLLPLSHMFGQAMATFIPPMLSGVTVFMRGYNPADIVRQIRSRRVSVVVCVPKILEVLREHVLRVAPEVAEKLSTNPGVAARWWRYRQVHKQFGFKFWAFVVGAAPLSPEFEAFWSRLGFLVIQGYGLTETAPIVTLNHPFRAQRGTVGTPIGGVDVQIAPDGEILVRGDNVTTGYYNAPAETKAAFRDGWFHTGDIGSLDALGRLTVRGRKKEVIVTPEGLNVFPEDVERVLRAASGVEDAAVVGAATDDREHVHAVMVLDPDTEPAAVLRTVNAQLEEHQRIRGYSLWSETALPRTEGTQKLKRRELKRWVETGAGPKPAAAVSGGSAAAVVHRFVPDRPVTDDTTLEELGLSSIERIELMMVLEQEFDQPVDEVSFAAATTVADLQQLVTTAPIPGGESTAGIHSPSEALKFPSWNRRRVARIVRRISLATCLLPLTRLFAWITVEGLEHLDTIAGPVVYASNHQSHLDTPAILAALPSHRRYRLATAAAKEFFAGHFHPEQHSRRQVFTSSLNYYLASLLFNVFPLPQREAGARDAIRYLGDLLGDGMSVLIFPEGRRTQTGSIDRFQPGIGMVAARLRVPIVPVRLKGLDHILHQSWRMARPGRAHVAFGPPLKLEGDDYRSLAQQVEAAVRTL